MKLRSLMRTLHVHSKWPESEIDQRVRPLRIERRVSSGPRGSKAPELSIAELAIVILSMVSRKATDAFETAMKAAELVPIISPSQETKFEQYFAKMEGPPHLVHMIGLAIMRPEFLDIIRLEVATDGARAWMTINDDGNAFDLLFVEERRKVEVTNHVGDDAGVYANQGAAYLGHRFVIGGGWLKQFAIDFRDDQLAKIREET